MVMNRALFPTPDRLRSAKGTIMSSQEGCRSAKSSCPLELPEADDLSLAARQFSCVLAGASSARLPPLSSNMVNNHRPRVGWKKPSTPTHRSPQENDLHRWNDALSATPHSDNSMDTLSLLNHIDNFSLPAHLDNYDENDSSHGTDHADRPRTRASHTPRLDNRSMPAVRAHGRSTPSEASHQLQQAPAVPAEAALQEWFSRWRTAVQKWVRAQKLYHEQQHEHLRQQLRHELREQHESIAELQAVVESQQDFLERFLLTHPAAAGGERQGRAFPRGNCARSEATSSALQDEEKPQNVTRRSPTNKGQRRPPSTSSQSTRQHERLSDGTRITVYANGTRKEQRDDGCCIIHFDNGDIQTVGSDGKTAYWFASTKVVRVEEQDCTLYQFPNGQLERHYPDGRKFVQFPNNRCRWVDA